MTELLINDSEFLIDCFNSLTEQKIFCLPSDYAVNNRYLSEATTSRPGAYSFDSTPYLKEIVDCFAPDSKIRQVAYMKGAHVGGTVGVIENLIVYNIGERPCPQIYITATRELAEKRFTDNIDPAIESCSLRDRLVTPSGNKKRSADKILKKEYIGGSLVGSGGQTGTIGRSSSFRIAYIDEIDAIEEVKGEGSFQSLIENRVFKAFRDGKVFYISTPKTLQTSNINKLFLRGDQRYYNIPCQHCGELIPLEWHIHPDKTRHGNTAGIIFETENDKLVFESVRYRCQICGGEFFEYYKKANLKNGVWIPTSEPEDKHFRSYHSNALYSPIYTWVDMTRKFLAAWDIKKNKVKDLQIYKDFRQTDQGLPFEEIGEAVKHEKIIRNRRMYKSGIVPNKLAQEDGAGKILFILCACDVQKDHLYIDVKGVCKNGITYTIDFLTTSLGDTSDIKSNPWNELKYKLQQEYYFDETGQKYIINCTFIDAGHNTDAVVRFCESVGGHVYPVFGRNWNDKDSSYKFSKKKHEYESNPRFLINTDRLKDRLFSAFKSDWIKNEIPDYFPFFPEDFDDEYFKFFSSESKVEIRSKITNSFMGYKYQPIYQGVPNHGLDTYIYFLAALDYIIERVCEFDLKIPRDWSEFWKYAETGIFYKGVS